MDYSNGIYGYLADARVELIPTDVVFSRDRMSSPQMLSISGDIQESADEVHTVDSNRMKESLQMLSIL